MKNAIIIIFTLLSSYSAICQKGLTEAQVVTLTILGEARGEGKAGMYAVSCVISQRIINRKLTAKEVCLESKVNKRGVRVWQFSCWGGKVDYNLLKTKEALYASALAANIKSVDRKFVKFADHYCHVNINNYWTKTSKPVITIGRHKFYKLRP